MSNEAIYAARFREEPRPPMDVRRKPDTLGVFSAFRIELLPILL